VTDNVKNKIAGTGGQSHRRFWEFVFVAVLVLYPLRHIAWGLDLWDTGYGYANFEYMGTRHMDPMWLFSTYLTTVIGHCLSLLPGAKTLIGMNFYTGLSISLLAVLGYYFCTKVLKIPAGLAFLGEFTAVSFCWCPTGSFYNYVTYIFFLISVICLYLGLSRGKGGLLFAAGVALGCNVLARFSNLPEAAMIVGVWAYGIICWLEEQKSIAQDCVDVAGNAETENKETRKKAAGRRLRKKLLQDTGMCLAGYLTALLVLFGYIQIRYGMDEYVRGIQRLFSMTEVATDYTAKSMILGMFDWYLQNLYWELRMCVFLIVGMIAVGFLEFAATSVRDSYAGKDTIKKALRILEWVVSAVLAVIMVFWLYRQGFCAREYTNYGAIIWPGVTFLTLTLLVTLWRIFMPSAPGEEKLLSGLIFLIVLITSLGSNNKLYPSMNNLFLALPYMYWQFYRFCKYAGSFRWKRMTISPIPAKCLFGGFFLLFFIQVGLFGRSFVFAEGTGVQEINAQVTNNETLKGVWMSEERAGWMQEISEYVNTGGLAGKDVLLYGQIPALSYYLQMPAAFNPWPDLDSYQIAQLEEDMHKMQERMDMDATYRPVVLLEKKYAVYLEAGENVLEALQPTEKERSLIVDNAKLLLIGEFMDAYGYEKTFENEKFVIFE
jgi:hypothetical protein